MQAQDAEEASHPGHGRGRAVAHARRRFAITIVREPLPARCLAGALEDTPGPYPLAGETRLDDFIADGNTRIGLAPERRRDGLDEQRLDVDAATKVLQIGRASCRERV